MKGWKHKRQKAKPPTGPTFKVGEREFTIRPMPTPWQYPFYFAVTELRKAQSDQFSALASGGVSACIGVAEDDALLRAVAVICGAGDFPDAPDPQSCIAIWAARIEDSLSRSELLQILETQIAIEPALKELEDAATWAAAVQLGLVEP